MKAHYQSLPVTSTPKQLHDQAAAQQALDGVPQQTTNSPATKAVATVPVKVPPSRHNLSTLEAVSMVVGGLLVAASCALVAAYWKNIVTWVQSLFAKKATVVMPAVKPAAPPTPAPSQAPAAPANPMPHTPGEPLHQ